MTDAASAQLPTLVTKLLVAAAWLSVALGVVAFVACVVLATPGGGANIGAGLAGMAAMAGGGGRAVLWAAQREDTPPVLRMVFRLLACFAIGGALWMLGLIGVGIFEELVATGG